MTTRRLLTQSIRHNWRTHLGVILGVALAALVLVGALMVGDSVKGTLRAQAESRVGKIGEALLCGERFVPWAADKTKRPSVVARTFFHGENAAGVLLMQGSATRSDGKARANKVQVLGVDESFWKLSPSQADLIDLTDRGAAVNRGNEVNNVPQVAINERIAAQLSLKPGDELSLYVEKPGAFSKDAPLSGEENALVTIKARVARVVGDAEFGRFALTASQVPPLTVFVPLGELQGKVGLGEKVNVVLHGPVLGSSVEQMRQRSFSSGPPSFKEELLHRLGISPNPKIQWVDKLMADVPKNSAARLRAEIVNLIGEEEVAVVDQQKSAVLELRSRRVFLDPSIVSAARENEGAPDRTLRNLVAWQTYLPSKRTYEGRSYRPAIPRPPPPGLDSLTYFVTELRAGEGKATPYSMVTAIDAPASGFVQAELAEDEIQVTRWLADDLQVKPGDKLTLRYNVMGERRELVEKERAFTILAPIIEMNEPQLDSSWMPDFPNIPDGDSFGKWKPGFPFDSKRIRKKDEEYWKEHRGTPKAFINLKAGQEMWGNRWGNLTSIRYRSTAVPAVGPTGVSPAGSPAVSPAASGGTPNVPTAGTDVLRQQVERIAAFIDPAALGFRVVNLREQALAATDAPVDFGQLFVSFSFFLIAAAAVLTGLLFTFTIEQRTAEAGLLLAVGWTRRAVRRLFLKEGALLAIIGSLLGAGLAALYTKAVLHALAGAWSGATGGTRFLFVATPGSVIGGIIGTVLMAVFAMWLASRRIFKNEAAALMNGNLTPAVK